MNKDKILKEIEKKVLWLSCWMIHNANHIRDNEDNIKVGGHQASCASMVSMMVALYFNFPAEVITAPPRGIDLNFGNSLKGLYPAFRLIAPETP